MKNAVAELIPQPTFAPTGVPLITKQDVNALKAHKKLLKEFISSQMREAQFSDPSAEGYGEGDYGIIPGSKKKSLLKPGAEKLLKLFKLGCRSRQVDKVIDRDGNFAMFTYRSEVYCLRTGVVIADCEGSTNSQENKYRERTVWKKKQTSSGEEISESNKEETPICDILNTLMKMTQKRSMIGAAIIATAASDYFTQDMEPDETPAQTRKHLAPAPESKSRQARKSAAPLKKSTGAVVTHSAPICCGKEMIVSKYPDRETGLHPYFCMTCRKKQPGPEAVAKGFK